MSKNSGDLSNEGDIRVGPDYFGFYSKEIAALLAEDADLLPFPHQISAAGKYPDVRGEDSVARNSCRTKEKAGSTSSESLYSNGIGALFSEFKKERLKLLLRQSVFTLSQEIDEIIDPVFSTCQIKALLRCKEGSLSYDPSACKADEPQHTDKKLKVSPTSKDKVGDDLRVLVESDGTKVEILTEKYSSELYATLQYMEKKLEELLDNVMSNCRPMTLAEKQQLRKMIQNLPPENLDHVVEILGRKKPLGESSLGDVHVDLDEQDQATLWRLYFYITTVQC